MGFVTKRTGHLDEWAPMGMSPLEHPGRMLQGGREVRRRDVPEHCHLEKPKGSAPTSIPTTWLTSWAILRHSSLAFYKQKLGSSKTALKEVINLGKYSVNIFLIINSYSDGI